MYKKNKKFKIKKKYRKELKTSRFFDPTHFFNREISWLEFNSRVLNEAKDKRTPLLERVKFLAIYSSNLDEFVMKRVGGLKRQLDSEYSCISIDGQSPRDQLNTIRDIILKEVEEQFSIFSEIKEELKKNKVELVKWDDLSKEEIQFCSDYFDKKLYPILTPLSVDPGKPFPFISSLSFSIGIFLEHPIDKTQIFSRVKVPDNVNDWVSLSEGAGQSKRMINTVEVIKKNLHKLYHGMKIIDSMEFRVTRNADWDHDDEDTEDLLELIEESINSRRLQEPIRFECLVSHNQEMLKYLMDELELTGDDLYLYEETFDFTSLFSLAELGLPVLKYPEWRPVSLPWSIRGNIFEQIKKRERFVHHPYENFQTSVEKFITDASRDTSVLSIKMTLYRTGDNSEFIKSLIHAAENGIQVVCLIELKARFDEKRNIFWAKKMEDAGVHVVYGIVGLKTHTKIAMIVRKESNGSLLRYAHIATGNYNTKTAKLYTDLGLFTTDTRITAEVNEVFNYLTGSSLKIDYKHLLVSPVNSKSSFLKLIYNQIKKATKEEKNVRIIAKMNSLEDSVLIEALYKASQAGVKITLIVRGFCSLKPGVKGLSENIKVISVVGRFLEHSRIYYFSDGVEDPWEGKYYIGSADWMHRNMHSRVEVIAPIYDKQNQVQLRYFLDVLLNDQRSAWELQSDGSYAQFNGEDKTGTHHKMMKNMIKILEKKEF